MHFFAILGGEVGKRSSGSWEHAPLESGKNHDFWILTQFPRFNLNSARVPWRDRIEKSPKHPLIVGNGSYNFGNLFKTRKGGKMDTITDYPMI